MLCMASTSWYQHKKNKIKLHVQRKLKLILKNLKKLENKKCKLRTTYFGVTAVTPDAQTCQHVEPLLALYNTTHATHKAQTCSSVTEKSKSTLYIKQHHVLYCTVHYDATESKEGL